MKKSNKILLGGFLLLIALISAIHITLFAKYKSGDFTLYNSANDLLPQSMQLFPNVLFVEVRNVPEGAVRFSDAARVEEGEESGVKSVQKGDTLLIMGTDSTWQNGHRYRTLLEMPANANVSVFNSSLLFEDGAAAIEKNPVFRLQKSDVVFSGTRVPLRLGNLSITATDSSAVLFQGNTFVRNLDLQLTRSALEYGVGDFGKMTLATDSLSRVSLQTKHLQKTVIQTITPK